MQISFAQNLTYFKKIVDFSQNNALYNVIETTDGYIGCGYSSVSTLLNRTGYLVKYDKNGNIINELILNDTLYHNSYLSGVIKSNLNYLVVGQKTKNDSSDIQTFVFDNQLNYLNSTSFGKINFYEGPGNIKSINDTVYFLCADGRYSNNAKSGFIYKISESGDSIDSKYYGYGILYFFDGLSYKYNEKYKIVGFNLSGNPNLGNDIVNLDSSFNIINIKSLADLPTDINLANAFVYNSHLSWLYPDSIYLVSAKLKTVKNAASGNDDDIAIFKMNAQNDSLLAYSITGKIDTNETIIFRSHDFIDKNHIYLTGISNFSSIPYTYIQPNWIILNCIDENMNNKWTRFFGGDGLYYSNQVLATSDTGCLVIGTYYHPDSNITEQNDVFLLKLGKDGMLLSSDNVTNQIHNEEFVLYPNPVMDEFKVLWGNNDELQLKLYDILGKEVYKVAFKNETIVDIKHLKSGTYTVILEDSKGRTTIKKIVKS